MISPDFSPAQASSLPRSRGALLKNLADFQTEVARTMAGFIPGLRDWPLRTETPRQIFADFRAVQDLRIRQRELGTALGEIHLSQAVPNRPLLELLCAASSAADAFWAVYKRVKPRLAGWIESLLGEVRGIYDLPTVPLLEANLELLHQQQAWARNLMPTTAELDAAFQDQVEVALNDFAAGMTATERRRAATVRSARQIGRLPLPDGVVPRGFSSSATLPTKPGAERPYAEHEQFYAMNFLQEVQAADSCAALLFDAPDLPWDFYFDVARHMWDESRHSMFGRLKLDSLGITPAAVALSTTAYRLRQTIAPHDRYAALTTQEADAFPGKHLGLKAALEHADAVGAMTWSYDIADETQHVRYGQKWLPALIHGMGDPRSPDQVRADAENWRQSVLTVAYRPEVAAGHG
jgi:hypothetical protein